MAEDFKNRSLKDSGKDSGETAEESLELEPLEEGPDFDRHLRKSYRVYVKDREDCTVTIENKPYPLKDVSLTGLGVGIETQMVLSPGQFPGETIDGVRLDLAGRFIEDLECRIVHISPDADNQMVCGMVWLNPTHEKERQLLDIVKSLKSESLRAGDLHENETRQT